MIRFLAAALVLTGLAFAAAAPARAQTIADFVVPAGERILVAFVSTRGTDATARLAAASFEDDPDEDLIIESEGRESITVRDWFFNAVGPLNTTLRRTGATAWSTFVGNESRTITGDYPNSWLHLQTSSAFQRLAIEDAGAGFARWAVAGRDGDTTDDETATSTQSDFLSARVVVVLTVTGDAPPADNCDMYLGADDLTGPGDLRLGGVTPARVYYGANLVCGDAP